MTTSSPSSNETDKTISGTSAEEHSLRLPKGFSLPQDRMLVMGILNVTPDSFSDGGLWEKTDVALAHGIEMSKKGADIIDVGGESTRPHSERITCEEEWRRIGSVIEGLAREGIVVSVDTLHAQTARYAAAAGAAIINDVSGGCFDPEMNETVAQTDCAYIVQHWRAFPGASDEDFTYSDVVGDVLEEIGEQVHAALECGVDSDRIVIDPGLGFSLTNEQSWEIVENMPRLKTLGYPVLIGASRKRFLSGYGDKDQVTAEITRKACRDGMWAVRVHTIESHAGIVQETLTSREDK